LANDIKIHTSHNWSSQHSQCTGTCGLQYTFGTRFNLRLLKNWN